MRGPLTGAPKNQILGITSNYVMVRYALRRFKFDKHPKVPLRQIQTRP